MKKEYLTEEEQFKEVLNNEQIDRIRDPELREIRFKYWRQRIDVFEDDHGIPDSKLEEANAEITRNEKRELGEYKKKKHNGIL